jgi:hypothetical protein
VTVLVGVPDISRYNIWNIGLLSHMLCHGDMAGVYRGYLGRKERITRANICLTLHMYLGNRGRDGGSSYAIRFQRAIPTNHATALCDDTGAFSLIPRCTPL